MLWRPAFAGALKLGDGPVIGFIGSFYDYEGLDDLIEATPLLLAERPDARRRNARRYQPIYQALLERADHNGSWGRLPAAA